MQRWRETSFLFLLVISLACMAADRVAAQSPAPAITMRPGRFECHMEAWPDRYRERNIDINYVVDPSQAMKFDDASLVRAFIESSVRIALDYCSRQPHFGGNHMPAPIPPTQVTVHV